MTELPSKGLRHMLRWEERLPATLRPFQPLRHITAAATKPREDYAPAIVHKAAGVILFHNHPSGDVLPSNEDIALTRRLVSGGALIGIEVLDHVIVSHDSVGRPYHSFSAHGQL